MASTHQRRWLSFSVRGLLVAITLVAFALGVWRGWLHPYQQQARAAARFRELGAVVKTEDASFAWARWLLGRERFQNVVAIDFASYEHDPDAGPTIEIYALQNVDSASMAELLKQFLFEAPRVRLTEDSRANRVIVQATPAQHRMIRALMETFDDRKTKAIQIREEDAALLAHCRELRVLISPTSTFGDAALAHLTCRESLTKLDLSETRVTDRGLALLSDFPNLDVLVLDRCQITDDGLRSLADCQQLQTLDLRHTPITNQGLEHLVRLPKLTSLDMSGTNITAESLATIDRFPEAKIQVVVDDTAVPWALTSEHPRVSYRPDPAKFIRALRGGGRGRKQQQQPKPPLDVMRAF